MGAASRKHTVLFLGRAGLCSGSAGLDCNRLRAVVLLEVRPRRATRRLALFAGIALNLAILVVYKYADFLVQNLNLALAPFGASHFPLLHLALPIGVSFVVFEKITYLMDTWRGISKPAATLLGLLSVRAVLSEAAGGADPQISRDEGSDRGAAARSSGAIFRPAFSALRADSAASS